MIEMLSLTSLCTGEVRDALFGHGVRSMTQGSAGGRHQR